MKTIYLLALVFAASLLLGVTCQVEKIDLIVINNSGVDIGFMATDRENTVVNNVVISPKAILEQEKAAQSIKTYRISNLKDTTSVEVSMTKHPEIAQKQTTQPTDTNTVRDSIINAAIVQSGNKIQWTVTDQLLTVMTYDPCLLSDYYDYYTK